MSVKNIPGLPEWHLTDRQRHESYEGLRRLLPEVPLVGRMHLLDALPHSLIAHAHPTFYELHCVLRGSLAFWVGSKTYLIRPGTAFLTRPGELHGGVDNVLPPAEWYWIQIQFPEAGALPGLTLDDTLGLQKALDDAPDHLVKASDSLQSCFDRLLTEHRAAKPMASQMARLVFHELLICLSRDLMPVTSPSNMQTVSPAVGLAIRWIERNLTETISVRQIAKAVGLGPSSLRQHFLDELKVSPSAYVTRQRVEKARTLLRETERSITDIANVLGFSTSSYFTSVFRRITGQTPSEYRHPVSEP